MGSPTKNSPERSNTPHFPGVPSLGINIDRCIRCNIDGISCRCHPNTKGFYTEIIFGRFSQEELSCQFHESCHDPSRAK